MRRKIAEDHGSAECLARVSAGAGPPKERTIVELLRNQLALQNAQRALTNAERELANQTEAERKACKAREAAAQAVEDARTQLNLLQGRSVRQRPHNQHLVERPPHYEKYSTYTIGTWLTEEGSAMRRRAVSISSGAVNLVDDEELRPDTSRVATRNQDEASPSTNAPTQTRSMTDGKDGWRHHWRHGMVGAVNYWAAGCRANVVKMLVVLARHEFSVGHEVAEELSRGLDMNSALAEQAIARNVKGAVQGLKPQHGSTEEQRKEYGIVLAAAFGAPSRVRLMLRL